MNPRNLGLVLFLFLGPLFPGARARAETAASPPAYRCELWQDEQDLPHAHAADEATLWACMGYLHGRDRAWQLDYFRRIVQGKTAELLGTDAVASDFTMRLLGLDQEAERIYAGLSDVFKARLTAYSAGVNAGMKVALEKGAYEFRSFNYQPEQWKPVDSVGIILLESFQQTQGDYEVQISQAGWEAAHGESTEELFSFDGAPWDTSILKAGEFAPFPLLSEGPASPTSNSDLAEILRTMPASKHDGSMGSNNWVVGPSRSASGHALLANDPHLGLQHPPFWYMQHIDGGRFDAIGAAVPGIPFIASGANEHMAWGLTDACSGTARLSYVPKSELKNLKTELPVILFKWGPFKLPFFFKSFQRTANGWPILPVQSPEGEALILRWSGFDLTSGDFETLLDTMGAATTQDFDHALSSNGIPSWNFVFADDRGQIGYRATGRIPKIAAKPAYGIPLEHLSELGTGESFPDILTPEQVPHLLNPPRDYIATANNRHWPTGTAPDPGWTTANGYRAFRIEELLTTQPLHDVDSFHELQCDEQAVEARFVLPALLSRVEGASFGTRDQAALALLKSWDYAAGIDCKACGVYRRWVDRLEADQTLNAVSVYRIANANGALAPEFEKSLIASLDAALDDLGVDAEGSAFPAWGEIHGSHFPHLAGAGFFKNASIPTFGERESVSQGAAFWDGKSFYEQSNAPSQRLIAELTSPPRVYSILAGSNEDVESPDVTAAGGPWKRWANCELDARHFPVDWSQVSPEIVKF